MVEKSQVYELWSYNLITNVLMFFDPAEVVLELRLHHVSKNFRKAVKAIGPYQMEQYRSELEVLLPIVQEMEERREKLGTKFREGMQNNLPNVNDLTNMRSMKNPPRACRESSILTMLIMHS